MTAVAKFLEACYEPDASDAKWTTRLARLFGPASELRWPATSAMTYHVLEDHRIRIDQVAYNERTQALVSETGRSPEGVVNLINSLPQRKSLFAQTYAARSPAFLLVGRESSALRSAVEPALPTSQNAVALFARSGETLAAHVGTLVPEDTVVSAEQAARFGELAKHLRVALGLRSGEISTERPVAVLTPDGRSRYLGPEAHSSPALADALRTAARRMDGARCRTKRQSSAEALDAWRAVIDGEYTIVESWEGAGRRSLVAVRVPGRGRRLTPVEAAVLREAARGRSNKGVADALGITQNAAALSLGRAMRKVGCPDRRTLIRWFGGGA